METLISVIVPAYNAAPWLEQCIDSILSQTYENLQIILIDDGSTDATPEIIDRYASNDCRILAIHQENVGLVECRNRGIALAEGNYITFVDSDDEIIPNMYEKLIKNLVKYQADISHCGVSFCFADGRKEMHYGSGKIIVQDNITGVIDLLKGEFIEPGVWNKLYKASILKNSCLDESIVNNEDLLRNFVAFSRAQKSVYEDFCGYKYYQREGSMSKDKNKAVKVCRHVSKARKCIVEHSTEKIYPYAMRTWLSSLVNAINLLTYNNELDAIEYCKECRNILLDERKNIHYLIKRQQFLAKIIMFSPFLHRIIYYAYKKIVMKEIIADMLKGKK